MCRVLTVNSLASSLCYRTGVSSNLCFGNNAVCWVTNATIDKPCCYCPRIMPYVHRGTKRIGFLTYGRWYFNWLNIFPRAYLKTSCPIYLNLRFTHHGMNPGIILEDDPDLNPDQRNIAQNDAYIL